MIEERIWLIGELVGVVCDVLGSCFRAVGLPGSNFVVVCSEVNVFRGRLSSRTTQSWEACWTVDSR